MIRLLSLLLFLSAPASAQTVPLFGHNLTATSYVFESRQCTAGLQVVGCGINESFSIGFIPWLVIDYDMGSALFRKVLSASEESRWAYQLAYFHTRERTNPAEFGQYDMKSIWNYFIYSKRTSPNTWVHFNQHINYYLRDIAPFSLRRPSPNRTPLQLTTSMLIEVSLGNGYFMHGELGALDWARSVQFHAGASLGYRGTSWSWHGGFSHTAALQGWFSPVREDYGARLRTDYNGYSSSIDQIRAAYDSSLHPEFSIQYFF